MSGSLEQPDVLGVVPNAVGMAFLAELATFRAAAGFDEALHPRDDHGEFTDGGGDSHRTKADRLASVSDYVLGGGMQLNDALRMGENPGNTSPAWSEWNKERIADLDALMKPTDKDRTLYRLADAPVFGSLVPGSEFQDKGFVSTTRDEKRLEKIALDIGMDTEFEHETDANGWAVEKFKAFELVIHAPKGTPMLAVNSLLGREHRYAHQEEHILARGTRFRVTSVEDTPTAKRKIYLEVAK